MKVSKNLKKNKVKIFYLFVLSFVFIAFVIVALLNFQLKKFNKDLQVKESPVSFVIQDYPILDNSSPPFVSAQGAIIMDRDSQVVVFEKNSNLRFSPASTTKIMSALVAMEYFDPEAIIVVNDQYLESANIELSKGDKFRFEDILYAMLLPSSNDAAKTISRNYPGGEVAFVKEMNRKAQELGLRNTYFADPAGLFDSQDYTTPIDLARLASIAMLDPEFKKIVSTKKKEITNTDGKIYELKNLNILLDLPGVNGVKTGFTQEAGQVLITSMQIEDTEKEVIIVVMKSEDRFGDSESLINFLNNNISYQATRQ